MTQHPTKQELNDYRRRVLAPDVFLSVHRHVVACPRCAAQSKSSADLSRDLEDLNTALLNESDDKPYHLSAVEVSAYARGESDEIDSEIAESHLSVCATCFSEVQRHQRQGKIAAPSFISPRHISRWQPLRVAAVVLFGAIVILLAFWLVRLRPAQQEEQAANPQSSPAAAQESGTPAALPSRPDVPAAQLSPGELVLVDGNQKIMTDKHGTLSGLERLPSPIQEKVKAALQTGRLPQSSDLAQLTSQPSTLLSRSGNGVAFPLIGPLSQVVRGTQPTFRWRALAGAQSYTVAVTDADLDEVATSPPLNTTQWRISKPLKEGVIYSWQVTALIGDERITSPVMPAPQAKFKVIDRSTAEKLQKAQRDYPDSRLTLGVLYAEAGLLDEAEQEFRMLVRNNPRARIALKLLQNVKAMRAAQTSGRL